MFILLKSHIKDKFVLIGLIISSFFFFLTTWFIFGVIDWKIERLVLHYNIIFGVDRLGEVKDLLYFFFGALGVLIFNYFFSLFLYAKDRIISRTVMFFGGFWQIFMFTAIYLIASLNS